MIQRYVKAAGWVLLVALAGCTDNGAGPEPEPPPEEAETFAKPFSVLDDATDEPVTPFSVLQAGDTLAHDVEGFETEEVEEDETRTYTVVADSYADTTREITFTDGDTETFRLTQKEVEAETAELTTSLFVDGDPYDATVYADESGEELASGSEFTLTREVGTELDIRIEGPDIETQTETLVFDKTKPVDISLTRAASEPTTVKLTITPEIADFTAIRRGRDTAVDEVTTYEITVGDETYVDTRADGGLLQEGSPLTVEVPANEEVAVSGRFVYIQESRKFIAGIRERNLALGEMNVSPNGDTDVTLEMTHQPACSDGGLDNDYDDVADRNEPGCTANYDSRDPGSDDFVYEANDDAELLVQRGVTGAGQTSDTYFISNKAGNRTAGAGGNTFHPAAKYAVGQMDIFIKNKPETDAGFAINIYCGPESEGRLNHDLVGTTDIVHGDASAEEFRNSLANGMDRSHISNGRDCGFEAIHESKVRDEDPGNGGEIIRFASETEGSGGGFFWFVEPEELPADLQDDFEGANNSTGGATMEAM